MKILQNAKFFTRQADRTGTMRRSMQVCKALIGAVAGATAALAVVAPALAQREEVGPQTDAVGLAVTEHVGGGTWSMASEVGELITPTTTTRPSGTGRR